MHFSPTFCPKHCVEVGMDSIKNSSFARASCITIQPGRSRINWCLELCVS